MDEDIFPAGMCTESEMVYVFVKGSNMSGMLLMTFGDQLNTSRCPELGEWLISEVLLQKNFSEWPMISNARFLGRWDQIYSPASGVLEGEAAGEWGRAPAGWGRPATRRRSGEAITLCVSVCSPLK